MVNEFNDLAVKLSFSTESDILEKVGKFNISLGTISRVIQPSLVQ